MQNYDLIRNAESSDIIEMILLRPWSFPSRLVEKHGQP